MSSEALDGLSVVDLSDGVAGQFAARVLAENGADVLLVEPPGGCATRRTSNAADRHLFWHLNAGKRALTLDRTLPAGQDAAAALVARADVAIGAPSDDCAKWVASSPRLVACTVRDFAATGPYAGWQGSEMIHQALSGLMHSTGRSDAAPLYGFGHRAYYSAGAAAVTSIMGALMMRDRTGQGRHLDVAVHETAVAMSQNLVAQYSYNGTFPARGPYPGPCDVFRCSDGWATMYCRGDRWAALCALLGDAALGSDPRFGSTNALVRNWPEAYAALVPLVSALTVTEFVERAGRARALASGVNTMADMLDDEHLAARRFWRTAADGDRERRVLGPLFRFCETRGQALAGMPENADA